MLIHSDDKLSISASSLHHHFPCENNQADPWKIAWLNNKRLISLQWLQGGKTLNDHFNLSLTSSCILTAHTSDTRGLFKVGKTPVCQLSFSTQGSAPPTLRSMPPETTATLCSRTRKQLRRRIQII